MAKKENKVKKSRSAVGIAVELTEKLAEMKMLFQIMEDIEPMTDAEEIKKYLEKLSHEVHNQQ